MLFIIITMVTTLHMYLLYSGVTVKCWWTENLLLAQTVTLGYHRNTDKAIYRLQLHCTFQETSCCSWLSLPFSVPLAYRRWNNNTVKSSGKTEMVLGKLLLSCHMKPRQEMFQIYWAQNIKFSNILSKD